MGPTSVTGGRCSRSESERNRNLVESLLVAADEGGRAPLWRTLEGGCCVRNIIGYIGGAVLSTSRLQIVVARARAFLARSIEAGEAS